MTDDSNATLQDVFADEGAATGGANSEGPFSNDNDEAGDGEDTVKGAAAGEGEDDGEEEGNEPSQKGGKAATPAAGEDDLEAVTDEKTGKKLIPEHRFKAALKSAEDRVRKEVEAEYNKPSPIPVPDKATDPQGHEKHIRMEASVEIMRDMKSDYQEVINHYAEMAKDNPLLDQAVDAAPIPARLAYDIAKKDLEIKEALNLKNSAEWIEFQEFQKNKGNTPTAKEESLNTKVASGLRAVPNLNRSTNASPNRNVRRVSNGDNSDDALWAGSKF